MHKQRASRHRHPTVISAKRSRPTRLRVASEGFGGTSAPTIRRARSCASPFVHEDVRGECGEVRRSVCTLSHRRTCLCAVFPFASSFGACEPTVRWSGGVGPGDAGLSAGDAGNRMQFIELGRVFPVAGSRTARRAASSLGPPAPGGGRVCAGRRVDRVPIAPMTALKVEEWTG